MSPPVVTRFAPSPTGYLHIGGARTALFNWLFAKANGGEMLLRIEDTDRERSSDDAVSAILDGLGWLGLDWSGEAYSQFQQAARHREIAMQLLAKGKAYKCYCSPQELTEMRELARAEGRSIIYNGTWRDRDASEAPDGVDPVIRFRAPRDGETIIDDKVQGRVVYQNKDLDDLIILRSDGSPTYNLSVVVDDHDMAVSHVIRGVDHLTNAARQSQIYQALGWQVPVMAHIPLIHGEDGAKLSKRHGALGVDAYRAMGYLPAAMRNYLARLGWSHGDDEIFSTAQMIEWFTIDGVGKSSARFDFAKLENLNGQYIRNTPDDALSTAITGFLPFSDLSEPAQARLRECKDKVTLALPTLKERAKNLTELVNSTAFITAVRPLPIDDKAEAILKSGGADVLRGLIGALENVADWSAHEIETVIKEHAEASGNKLGKIAQPLRAALTGTTVSPGIFDVLVVLGRQEVLDRIRDQLA